MKVLLTGAAGFIGFHTSQALLAQGHEVVGVDNLNSYYEVTLKEARLAQLTAQKGFAFEKLDISDRDAMLGLAAKYPGVTHVIHLAAQAGVRHSLTDPYTYVTSNVMGQVILLELARKFSKLEHFVYASSSSVYGGNTKLPFSIDDETEQPNSLYAATKKADELIGHTYAHLYGVPATGLRFFTVYGPWGRPDMAAFLFTRAILKGEPISVFNHGEMWRDFTYVEDIVSGILAAVAHRPKKTPPHAVYNLGNHKSEKLTDFIGILETALGRKATYNFEPMQPGDVARTYADIDASRRDLGFEPKTPISEGIPKFVAWYKDYYRLWPKN
ncbi:MAG: NAD-dependent epimerase/dehydratase family protein [Alphaproteobacteria bacterium]|nr:NAD-dependent epimerase/dehydratase family protein [Alphaproteobacteria bacterium]